MTYDFSGKVVLITGGTGVLGRAVAQAFGTFNATTVVTYIIDEDREGVKSKNQNYSYIYNVQSGTLGQT